MSTTDLPLDPIEKASIDELRALQLQRLQKTLAHAYANSPVYKAKFDAAGVHPDDCRTLMAAGADPLLARLLAARAVAEPHQLADKLSGLIPFGELKDCEAAAARLAAA